MSSALLRTKLHILPVRPNLVPRQRLIERLNGGLHRKLTLISATAPPGATPAGTRPFVQVSRMADIYQIRIKGHLDLRWSDWFDGLTVTHMENGETILSGPIRDQAALYGLLAKLRDLGLPLLAVTRLESQDG